MKTFTDHSNYTQTLLEGMSLPPEERTAKNYPKKSKFTIQQWLSLKGQGSKGSDGKFYGWSHRAMFGFKAGDTVGGDSMAHVDYDWGDSDNGTKHKSYKIKDDADAKAHALRFNRAVS